MIETPAFICWLSQIKTFAGNEGEVYITEKENSATYCAINLNEMKKILIQWNIKLKRMDDDGRIGGKKKPEKTHGHDVCPLQKSTWHDSKHQRWALYQWAPIKRRVHRDGLVHKYCKSLQYYKDLQHLWTKPSIDYYYCLQCLKVERSQLTNSTV